MNNGTNYNPNGVPPAQNVQGVPIPPRPPVQGQVPPQYPPQGYAPQPMPMVQPIPKRQYNFSQKMLALAMVLFGYLYMRMFLFEAANIGKTVFVFLLLLVSAGYMAHTGVRPGAAAVAAGILTAVLSLAFMFGLSGGLLFLLVVVCQLGYTYFVYKSYDTTIEKAPGRFFDFDMLRAVFTAPFSSFGSVFPALFSTSGEKNKRVSKKLGLILLGLVISVIPTVIVVRLLSFDSNFTSLLDQVMGIDLLEGSVLSHFAALVLGLPVAMYMYGLWTSCTFKMCRPVTAESCAHSREKMRVLPPILAFASVTPILFVYTLFFISQIGNYTAAFGGMLPKGYTYAEYARSGFFELCAVMVINLILVVMLFLLVRGSGRNGIARIYTALISIFTLILAATAASKMMLYVAEYGLTLRRVCTLWFMMAVAMIFTALLIESVLPKLPLIPVALTVSVVMFGVLMLSNAPARISQFNAEQILAGADWELDEEYFYQLGDAGVPEAVQLEKAEKVNAETRRSAADFLDYYEDFELREKPMFSEYSLARIRAEQAIREREPYAQAETE